MIAFGVFAGAKTLNMDTASNPGTPDAATVGKPGIIVEGLAPLTASAFNFPALICAVAAPVTENMTCTCPPIRSVNACPVPL